jgi:hypothetical protein
MSPRPSLWFTGDEENPCPCRSSYIGDIREGVEMGDADRMMASGGEPEMMATLLNMSRARRLDCEFARALRLAFDVVMEGSVADALSSLGRLPLGLDDESLLCMLRRASVGEADMLMWCCVLLSGR